MENETEKINSVAMNIIMTAGDARFLSMQALSLAVSGDFESYEDKMKEGKKKLVEAHGIQTEIIQSEGEGKKYEHTLLFIHAQDTLMTVYSEINIIERLKPALESIERRLTKLENLL